MTPRVSKIIGILCSNALLFLVLMAGTSAAQSGTTSISGTVTDPQGAVVAGATVRLVNEDKGFSRTATTNDAGGYTFTSVPPDTYKIEVEATGFKKLVVSNLVALVDKPKEHNATLEAGNISEVVNVSGGGLENIVNTTDASLGNNFVSQQILQLPLQARNVANLLSLQPGVTPDGSVIGGRSDQANITLDGIDVNNQQNAAAFDPVLRVNPDSVEEFRVTTSNPDASKGRSSGAQISLITKSGNNEFHGAVYEYHRNTVTAANDWFSNAAGHYRATDTLVVAGLAKAGAPRAPRAKLLRNLYGGRIGGPIVRDRVFFFYNYEAMREAKATPVSRLVPTATLGAGNIRFNDNTGQQWTISTAQINTFTLNGAPVVDVNPLVPALFASAASRYPCNDTTVGDGRNSCGFRFNAPVPVELDAHTARIDWTLTSDQKHQLSLRGNYQQDIIGVAAFFPDTPPTSTWSHPLGFAATHTWLVKSNMTNRFSYGMSRIAFSNQGDSADPTITFRYIFQPVGFGRTFNRVNPTQNFTDDFTWIRGNHSFQFGTNVRLIKNDRTSFARAFDNGITNPSAYPSNIARVAIEQYITAVTGSTRTVASAWDVPVQGAVVALFGRLNGYGANFNFKTDGTLQAANTGVRRIFETKEYDWYFQDAWKIAPNLTLTAGLRYGLSMPVTETQGFETVPNIVLSEYLRRTEEAMNRGVNYREPLSVRLAGKSNGLDSIYPLDKNNFQPRVSIAWSPSFDSGFLSKLFGKSSESVFRGGFAMTNDYFGQQLATNWDGSNTLGFSSSATINVNTYNITTNPAPLYTGPGMSIRSLPNLAIPGNLSFPQTAPFRSPGLGKIETSLDQNLVSPVNYTWNFSYGRRLPGNIWIDAAYVARLARNLLIGRDAMMLRNVRDTRSGLSYNQAAAILDRLFQAGVASTAIPNVAFFDNMWAPGSLDDAIFGADFGWSNTRTVYEIAGPQGVGDWTYMMQVLDDSSGSRYFFQGQYDSLSAFSTAGTSDYHGATLSIRQRFTGITWDFNYTFSKSFDEASGLQTGGLFGSAFVLNAFALKDQRAVSDFDLTHVINFNGIWDIPIGRNRTFGRGMNKWLNGLVGGWQLSGIFRYDSGYPFAGGYFDSTGWQTNWNIRSYNTRLRKVDTAVHYNTATSTCTTGCTLPNLFGDPNAAWRSFRTPEPGETGTRNAVRLPGSLNLDAGLAKSFDMPWKEGHKMTIRWDVFNVTNSPMFAGQSTGVIGYTSSHPTLGSQPSANFGRFSSTRNNARVMQFAFRYDF